MQNDSNLFWDTSPDARHDIWMCTSGTSNNPAGDYSGLSFPGNQVDCCIIFKSNCFCSIDQDLVLKKSKATW
jgi:hypothetical protein